MGVCECLRSKERAKMCMCERERQSVHSCVGRGHSVLKLCIYYVTLETEFDED